MTTRAGARSSVRRDPGRGPDVGVDDVRRLFGNDVPDAEALAVVELVRFARSRLQAVDDLEVEALEPLPVFAVPEP